jgi:PAS domain S-box-containing protein
LAEQDAFATAANANKPHILFVEDEVTVRDHLAAKLSDEYRVVTASDGKEALLAIMRAKPDLVVADVMMPDLDGIELLKTLRSTPQTQTLPVLLISGRAPDEMRIEGFELGADEYLAKPYTERELRARIRSMLRSVAMRREATRREAHDAALQQATAERAALLESITHPFYALDSRWQFIYINQRALDYLGKSRDEVIGKTVWDIVPASRGTVFQFEFERAVREQASVAFEVLSPFSRRWVEVQAYPNPLGLSVNFRDITARKEAEEAREAALRRERQTNALVDSIFTSAPIGLAFIDRQLCFQRINDRLAEMNGLHADAHVGKRPDEILPKLDDLKTILTKWREIIETGEPLLGVEVQGETHATPGQPRTWLESFFPVRLAGETIGLGVVAQDITRQKESERELRESQDRYRAFVEHSSEGIWRYELDEPLDITLPIDEQVEHAYRHARLAELNDAMARMYGYERAEELIGAPLARMLPSDDAAARAYLKHVAESGYTIVDAESAEPDRDGRIHYFENSIVPVIEDGKLLRVWGVQREITERKRAEAALRESDRRKDEFLALLAHELRNPLAPIRNGIQIFKLRATSDQLLQSTARMMDRQMAHLVRLVDDLLEVSRITHGRLELILERVKLADVLARAVESSRIFIEAKGHELIVDVRAGDAEVAGDADRLVQVFSNLLSNSAKYTQPKGRITMTLDRSGCEAVVTVQDTGIGIPEEALEDVFQMFSQVKASRDRSGREGLGIGLSLARTLLGMQKGTISAFSEGPGKGSTFTVRLPLVAAEHADTAGSLSVPADAPLHRKSGLRVVVADDNEDAAQSLAMLLELEGYAVKTAADGEQAVKLAREFKPDVIFMDVGMPNLNGLEATRAIRAQTDGSQMRIVAMTGWGQEEDRRQTEAAGMDYHLTKPVSPESLQKALAALNN